MIFGSESSHCKHFARLLNARNYFHFNNRSKENAAKGFTMFFSNDFEHLVHLMRSPVHVLHILVSVSKSAVIVSLHQAQAPWFCAGLRSKPWMAIVGLIHRRQKRSMPLLTTSSQAVSILSKSNCERVEFSNCEIFEFSFFLEVFKCC